MRLSDVTRERKDLAVPFGDLVLNVVYKPQFATPALLSEFARASQDPLLLAKDFCAMVDSWDLVDDEDHPIPVDEKHVANVPISVLQAVILAIGEDMRPNPQKAPA